MSSIHLQGLGQCKAQAAELFNVNDKTLWNCGAVATIVAIRPVGKCFMEFDVKVESGKIYQRKVKRDRMIAFA